MKNSVRKFNDKNPKLLQAAENKSDRMRIARP